MFVFADGFAFLGSHFALDVAGNPIGNGAISGLFLMEHDLVCFAHPFLGSLLLPTSFAD